MLTPNLTLTVRRPSTRLAVIDVAGDVTAAAEAAFAEAFTRASSPGIETVALSFVGLEYMNSSGIGLLVALLIRANRQKQRLLACGLSDHYREIFNLTRLDDAIRIFDGEADVLSAAA